MKFFKGFPKEEVLPEIQDDKTLLSETTEAPAATRKMADKNFLFVFGALVLIVLPLIVYTLYKSDINRLNGYDDCGNVCGRKNFFDPKIPCSGVDYTKKPFYKFLSKCDVIPPDRELDFLPDIYVQFSEFAKPLVRTSLVALGLSLALAVGFLYAPFFTIVGVLIISWGHLVVATLGVYYLWYWPYHDYFIPIGVPMILTALTVIMLCLTIYARNTIIMIIMLFKEASKALCNIQMLPLIPVMLLTLLIATALVVVSTITHLHMSTAGILDYTRYSHMEYVPNGFMIAAIVLNIVLTVWTVQVMIGLQNMTVSSAVSKWYSSRCPAATNYCTTLKNHIGSVFLGSIVMICVSIPRSILICISQISIFKNMADWFLRFLNGFNSSYIITASQGSSFLKSSKKSRQLLNMKIGHATGVKYLGSFVMLLCQILICWVSIVVYFCAFDGTYAYYYPYNCNYIMLGIYFLIVISLLCCYTLLGPIQVAFDTMFICACEDILKEGHQHNSMSIEEFHSNAAEVLEKKIRASSQLTTTVDAAV